jgi:DNA-3-methyladenine glycosylase
MSQAPRMLDRSFFLGKDVVHISKQLLGKYLAVEQQEVQTVGRIVEVEAYDGIVDKACHAYPNRRTARTEIMFAAGGHAYVYLCYGIHHLFNIVTGPAGVPHAILIRALEPVENVEAMKARRKLDKVSKRLTAGPGMFTQAMGITTVYDGIDLLDTGSPIWLEDRGEQLEEDDIQSSTRIGIDYAKECALWPWRFYIKGNKWVSKL